LRQPPLGSGALFGTAPNRSSMIGVGSGRPAVGPICAKALVRSALLSARVPKALEMGAGNFFAWGHDVRYSLGIARSGSVPDVGWRRVI
jgi:hypothetical protein